MQTIAFVIPWGGVLPNYFRLWLKTCETNPTVDFFVFTDDKTHYNAPPNVRIINMEYGDIIRLFQSNFDFNIAITKPYKFCDFKPAYGEIFTNYLKGYDFWEYCDIDLLWGDIRKFITEDILNSYDRIYTRGHCSIFRNNTTVNAYYRTLPNMGHQNWKDVFQSEGSFCFDEWAGHMGGGFSTIMKSNNIKMYDKADMADLKVNSARFSVNRRDDIPVTKELYFKWNDGRITANILDAELAEFVYVHFQKRSPAIRLDKKEIESINLVCPNLLKDNSKSAFYRLINYDIRKLIQIAKNRLK